MHNDVYEIAARRGIFFGAFGIYGELGGFYDFGPIGTRIKKNIEALWRDLLIKRTGAYEVDTSLIVSEPVLTASGHLATFTDPIVYCEVCGTPYRADKLVEAYFEKRGMLEDEAKVKKENTETLEKQLKSLGIKCEKCGNSKFSKIEKFNLVFKTQVGPTGKEPAYLRPETAQGIFVDFYGVYKTYSPKLPVLIGQAGKSFRNEISPRQQLIRQREFGQMELELFFDPAEKVRSQIGIYNIEELMKESINFAKAGSEEIESAPLSALLHGKFIPNEYFAFLLFLEKRLITELGITEYRFRQLEPEELPHYSKGNVDLEAKTSYGFVEIAGNAYRTDFDLSQHAKLSGKDLSIDVNGKKIVPHVVEASVGLDRLFLATLESAYQKGEDRGWAWLKLNERVAPYKYAVLPLQKDDKLAEKAMQAYRQLLEKGIDCYYAESGSIGKRYAKADEIGVPYCITIDYQTLEDDTVTIRNRDTTQQVRKQIFEIS
ncbi:MAG: glycine--tRNA ligase [Candidatus Micrarchaeia archaeon]